MAKYCLTRDLANIFKQKLQNGEIDPGKLSTMTSEDRHNFFKDFLGEENAKNVNSLFESKLLLKNQQQGMITWAKTVAGLKPEIKKDLVDKINKMEDVLNPKTEETFLKDLASTRLGVNITMEESKKIFNLAQKATSLKNDLAINPTDKNKQESYGMAVIQTENYKNELTPKPKDLTSNIIGILNIPRSLVATFDVSAPFRHAWGSTTRGAFWSNYVKMYKYLGSQNSFDKTMGRIVGHPDYPLLKDSGVRISELAAGLSKREDQFMSPLLDKIPILKGSERSYIGFLNGLRADLFYNSVRSARLAGEDVSKGSKVLKDLGNTVNIMTGTANVGRFETASEVFNAINFSFRKTAGDIKMLYPGTYIDPRTSPTARKEALRSVIGSVSLATGLLIGARLMGAQVETDPRSSDFGKIKIGNRRIDVTGGRAAMVTLISRLITGQTKSTTTGIITTLGKGYKPQTRMGVLLDFERNKLYPTASAIVDFLVGTDYSGKPTTLQGTAFKLFTPMLIQDAVDLANSNNGIDFLGTALSLFGIPVTSYAASTTDWTTSQSSKLQQFQSKVSTVEFNKANTEYNNRVDTKLQQLQSNPKFQQLSPNDQQKVITQAKNKIENQIFTKYSFHYRPQRNKNSSLFKQLSQ